VQIGEQFFCLSRQKTARILCVFQDFLTQAGGKYAAEMRAGNLFSGSLTIAADFQGQGKTKTNTWRILMEGYYSTEALKALGLKAVGENVLISKKASIYLPEKISIGSNVRIDDFCFLVGDITLGNYIHISPYTSIHGTGGGTVVMKDFSGLSGYCAVYAGSDDYSGEMMTNPMIDKAYRKVICSNIVLEKHSVVGLHSVLLPGALLAEGTALGAMSLLRKPTEAWGIYVGIPAQKVKDRKKGILDLELEFFQKEAAGRTR